MVAPTSTAHALGDSDDIEIKWVLVNAETPRVELENFRNIELQWVRERSGQADISYSTMPPDDLTSSLISVQPSISTVAVGVTSLGPLAIGDTVTLRVKPLASASEVERIVVTRIGEGDSLSLSEVVSLGNLGLISLRDSFRGAPNFTMTASLPSSVVNLQRAFEQSQISSSGIGAWNVGNVTNFNELFSSAVNFNEDISGWNTASVTDMRGVFFSAVAFNQDISGWNTSSVTTTSAMFRSAIAFNQDITGWNTSSVTDMSRMFNNAQAFNQDISGWNTAQVTDMSQMFFEAAAFNHDIGALNITKIGVGGGNELFSMLSVSGMIDANYAATLNGWVAQPVRTGVFFGATGKIADTCARVYLADTRNWNIVDGWRTGPPSPSVNPALDARRAACSPATISWEPASLTTNRSPFSPSPLPMTSGGDIFYSVDSVNSTSDCRVDSSSGVVVYTTVGTCTVVATAAATELLYPNSQSVTFELDRLPPANLEWSISDAQRTPAAFQSPFTPAVLPTSTDGVPITYSVIDSGTTGCTVNATTGTISYIGGGNCTVRATTGETDALSANSLDVVFELPAPLELPGTPGTPVATVADGSISLSWTAPTAGGDTAGYTVTSSPAGAVCVVVATTASCTGLTAGVTYSFTVSAVNASGTSPASALSNAVVARASSGAGAGGDAESGAGGLANTGFEAQGLLAIALALLTVGAVTVLSVRETRRRKES
jgi:surface protein